MGTESKTILLVEDERLIALGEAKTLEAHGFRVVVAHDGESAIREGRTDAIDLILMDIDLGRGKLDGTQAAEAILAEREVPIVFLTSHTEQDMVERVRGITRYGYVLKSTGEFVLIQSIEMAFELFEARRSLQGENDKRSKVEEQLKQRNTFIETILNNLPIGLAVNSIDDGHASYMNRQFESIYGWPRDVIIDVESFFRSVYPDETYRAEVSERIMADMASGDPSRMKWRGIQITRQSGERAVVDAMNIPIVEQNIMISTVLDVTEHHDALSALRESEARYRAVASNLPNGMIALYDSNLRFAMAAGSELEAGPLSPEDFVGKELREIYPKEIADRDEPSLRAALDGHTTDQVVHHAGRYYRVVTAPVFDGDTVWSGLVMTQDITDAKKTEIRFQRVAEQLDLAIKAAHLGLWTQDRASQRFEWNDELLAICGLSRDEFEADSDLWRQVVHPDDLGTVEENIAKIAEGTEVRNVVFRVNRPDGETRVLSASGTPIRSEGEIKTLIGLNMDVTESLRREEALAEAVDRQRIAVQESNHRIKNNLLTLSALIGMAEREEATYSSLRNQLNSIIAVHDSLARAEFLGQVELQSLLRDVAQPHLEALQKMGVPMSVESVEYSIDSSVAVPMALIANELIANAIRHGVRVGHNDSVGIKVSSNGDQLDLVVENSGNPFPEDPSAGSGSSGWLLIRALADQLGAELSVEREPRTRVTVRIGL